MFTWIPIYEEAAKRLLEYEERNRELVDLIAQMKARGLKTTKIADQGENEPFDLKEIDPFSFLANFNRGTTVTNRRELWAVLKKEWQLASDLPDDFRGIPIANAQNSWFMPYAKLRSPEHVPLLWEFFRHIMTVEPTALDAGLMDRCLALPQVGMAMLTMGMFWACPRKWIATDGKNLAFAESKGASAKVKNAQDYVAWLPKIRQVIGGDAIEFSHQAHLWATQSNGSYGAPFNKLFPNQQADRVLDYFARVIGVLRQEAENPSELLAMTLRKRPGSSLLIRINIWMWATAAIVVKPNQRSIEFLLPFEHPEASRCQRERRAAGDETGKGFAEAVDGVRYDLCNLDESLFFERFDDLWPDIEAALRAICRHFSGRRSPFHLNHRPELEAMCMEPGKREMFLREGLPFRTKAVQPSPQKRRYWLIAPGEGAKYWDQWLKDDVATIGWSEVGDLNQYAAQDDLVDALDEHFTEKSNRKSALMLQNFRGEIREGDILFAKLGISEILGWGEVNGEYIHDGSRDEHPNLLPVSWTEQKAVKLPDDRKLPQKTLTDITGDTELLSVLGKEYSEVPGLESSTDPILDPSPAPEPSEAYTLEIALAELFMTRDSLEHILEQLKRKKNVILQGAPGVGKTFIAKRLAWLHLGVKDPAAVEMVQFHQSYTYEDFVQGLRPTKDGRFAVKDGCFYRLCRKALANPEQDFFLVIDEINRGNLSKILGELMMLIETDKRGESLTLAYSEETFTVPPNLYLIGTMNTADRSLSLVDYALRRRFAFLTLDPGFETDAFAAHLGRHGVAPGQIDHIRSQMAALNAEIVRDEANLGNGYRIGHSFFTPVVPVTDFEKWFQSIVRYEVMPLLEEYWIDDPKLVEQFRSSLTAHLP